MRRLAAGLRLLRDASPDDRRRLRLAWMDLLVCRLQVRSRRAFPEAKPVASEAGPSESGSSLEGLVAMFDQAVATCIHGTPCLARSLALRRFLRRFGTETRLRLGMRKTETGWAGHAWLERNGQVLADREELVRLFVPFRETA